MSQQSKRIKQEKEGRAKAEDLIRKLYELRRQPEPDQPLDN